MKKYLSIVLGMLLVLGFAGSAFAIHLDIPSDDSTPAVASGSTSITLSGEIRERYDFRHIKFNDNVPDYAFFDQRVRLGVQAKLSPNTMGFIQLESNSGDTNNGAPDSIPWGTGSTNNPLNNSQTNITASNVSAAGHGPNNSLSYGWPFAAQSGNYMLNGLSILNAWILHQGTGLLGVNAGFKVGHQPIALPNGLFLDHSYYGDDGIVAFINPIKELEMDVIYLKLRQNFNGADVLNLSDSTNGYAFTAMYKPDKTTAIGFDATYLDVQNLGDAMTAFGTNTVTTATQGTNTGILAAAGSASLLEDVHLWNFGLHANTAVAGFTILVDGEIQTGTIFVPGMHNVNIGGYAAKAAVGYKLNPVTLTLEAAYGSGDDGKGSNRNDTFITFMGPVPHYSYVFDYRTVNAAGGQYGGLQNVGYLKLDAKADVTKDLNVDVAILQLQAAHAIKSSGGGVAGLNYNLPGSTVANPAGSRGNSNIGTEVDGTISYQIDKGLKIYAEGGYLWAGDFWMAYQTTGSTSFPNGASVKSAYTVREGLILNF